MSLPRQDGRWLSGWEQERSHIIRNSQDGVEVHGQQRQHAKICDAVKPIDVIGDPEPGGVFQFAERGNQFSERVGVAWRLVQFCHPIFPFPPLQSLISFALKNKSSNNG
jgi:hypothetical protein